MDKKQFNLLRSSILSENDDLRSSGRLIFISPISSILRGIFFENSGFDKYSFYVTWFFLPMYVETNHLYFNFGSRILTNGADRWSLYDKDVFGKLKSALDDEILPKLQEINSIGKFIEFLKSLNHADPYALRAIAYSFVRLGEASSAIHWLNQLNEVLDGQVAWQRALQENAQLLMSNLQSDPKTAEMDLVAVEKITAGNLHLQDYYTADNIRAKSDVGNNGYPEPG